MPLAKLERFLVIVGLAAIAGCAGDIAGRGPEDQIGDRQDDILAAIPDQPRSALCPDGAYRCKGWVRTEAPQGKVKIFAAPAGFGPAELTSAYKLDTTKGQGMTIGIVDAFHYPAAE